MKRVFLLIPVILIVGCFLFGGEDYYPLKVGNIWKYTGYETSDSDTISKMIIEREITGEATIGGENVFVSAGKSINYIYSPTPDTTETIDTMYIKETNDTIWAYNALDDTMPVVVMILPLEENKSWVQVLGANTYTHTVQSKEDVTVPAQEYKDCWKVEVAISGSSVKRYYWLADDVGMVKYYYEYTTSTFNKWWLELTEATIK